MRPLGRPPTLEGDEAPGAPVAAKMTRVGEDGGRLTERMIKLADHYDDETSYSVDKLTSKLEPLAIIIMIPIALLVGGVYALMTSSMQAVTQ